MGGWPSSLSSQGGRRAHYQSVGSQGEKAQAVQGQVAGVAVYFQFFRAATCPAFQGGTTETRRVYAGADDDA